MLSSVLNTLRTRGRDLAVTAALFELLTFVVLAPAVSLMFRLFIGISGRRVLADTDMLVFFLHPLGWLTAVLVGGAWLGILALQQGAVMSLALDPQATPRGALLYAARRWRPILGMTCRITGRLLLVVAPFLAVGGAVYWWLLTAHDINFYLTEKPPEFRWAVRLGGVLLLGLAVTAAGLLLRWAWGLPLILFEGLGPREALSESTRRTTGQRRRIAGCLASWLLAMIVVSLIAAVVILLLGRVLVAQTVGTLWLLVLVLGGIVLLAGVANFLISLLGTVSFGLVLTELYVASPGTTVSGVRLSAEGDRAALLRLNRRRLFWGVMAATVAAALIGVGLLETVELEDRAEVIAHRAGSVHAPENTLAAVERAIADGADWVEIDVQESADGVVVVVHDSDLKKLADVDFRIWEATLEEIQAVDIGSRFSSDFAGEHVPTLADVLTACQGRVRVNIELKYYGHDERLEQRVADLVTSHEMQDDIVLMSLKYDGVRKMKELRPEWRVGLLAATAIGDLSRLEADFLAVNVSLATPALIASAHSRGQQIYVWTVNDPLTMSTMIGRGVDGIITDDPALARQVLEFRAGLNPLERGLLNLGPLLHSPPEELRNVEQ